MCPRLRGAVDRRVSREPAGTAVELHHRSRLVAQQASRAVLKRRPDRIAGEGEAARGANKTRGQAAASWLSVRRMMRDTCICETPTRAPISV